MSDTRTVGGVCGHELKVWRMYFDALKRGDKTFEFRKDDRTPRYEVGDVLWLREWGGSAEDYTGQECYRRVTYVARGGAIADGFCAMSVVPADAYEYQEVMDDYDTVSPPSERVAPSEERGK